MVEIQRGIQEAALTHQAQGSLAPLLRAVLSQPLEPADAGLGCQLLRGMCLSASSDGQHSQKESGSNQLKEI